jgi:hypothetical protein
VERAELGDGLISVLSRSNEENPIKPWGVAKVTLENGKYVHEAVKLFFTLDRAKKMYFELLGITYESDTVDDYC